MFSCIVLLLLFGYGFCCFRCFVCLVLMAVSCVVAFILYFVSFIVAFIWFVQQKDSSRYSFASPLPEVNALSHSSQCVDRK